MLPKSESNAVDIPPPYGPKIPFMDYTFSVHPFHGPLLDHNDSRVYTLREERGACHSKGITVTRGNGTVVGELRWGSILAGPTQVTINGRQIGKLFDKTRSGIFSRMHYNFKDDQGNQLYWRGQEVGTSR